MDLVDTLRKKIDVLDEGDYVSGLKAVLSHIETAFRHLSRGQSTEDETAFTDAIYRTNQAFEGSIKEAFRVLAEQDPAKKTPFEIEKYLDSNYIFRPRVLSQLTNYRTEWRNPSAHDYKLDFDESEAFLAIVSVSAFACLLLDQIGERLAFKKSQAETEALKEELAASLDETVNSDISTRVSDLLIQFCASHLPNSSHGTRVTEYQIIGAAHGFISSMAPELTVYTEVILGDHRARADMIIERGSERVIVEIKRPKYYRFSSSVSQLEHYKAISGISNGILLVCPEEPGVIKKITNPGAIVLVPDGMVHSPD